MTKTFRLSEKEQEALRKKSIEINKIRIKNNLEPKKDSEILHDLIDISMGYIKTKASGEIFLDLP